MCNINQGLRIPINNPNNDLPTIQAKNNYLSIPLFTYYENMKKQEKMKELYKFASDKKTRDKYNDEMVKQTWKYQKQYGFGVKSEPQHEFHNVEADAFKHTFGSADLYLKYGNLGSLAGGIHHEWTQDGNPHDEWNMDSWNNYQGRKIAKEIKRTYGETFDCMTQEQKYDIIADRVMQRMRSGKLITNPDDKRIYHGILEHGVFGLQEILEKIGIKGKKRHQ